MSTIVHSAWFQIQDNAPIRSDAAADYQNTSTMWCKHVFLLAVTLVTTSYGKIVNTRTFV